MQSDWQHLPFVADLEEKPWAYSFFQLCRWMDAQSAPHPPLGLAPLPHHEVLRLGQKPSTAFATREIAETFRERGHLHVHLLGLGLWGPGGPLPLHLTEEAHERALVLRDTTLIDFLNIFHHRWLSHFYRAWSMAQSAAGLDRAEEERFSFYVSCLAGQAGAEKAEAGQVGAGQTGTGQAGAKQSASGRAGVGQTLPQSHARLSAVAHLTRRSRNPVGLVATLEHYFGVTVRLEEYCFHWLKLEPEAHCRLGLAYASCRLGQDAVLGGHVPDRQYRFALHVGPLNLTQYCAFLPGQAHAQALLRWVREFTGVEFAFRVHLSLHPDAVPPCTLGGQVRLGRTTWLGRSGQQPVAGQPVQGQPPVKNTQPVKGAVFG